ncbi:MAG TPA: pitrilysin family protein [Gemmatimonadales bacterium]|nr:pitrilysin family protein [Gemmatimonadales bacterium]
MNSCVASCVACLALAAVGLRPAAAQQFPTTPPAPAPMAPEHFPRFHEATLPNGLHLVLVENHTLPIVSIVLTMPTGEVNDPPTEAGLARLTAALITKGTTTRPADSLAAEIAGAGGSLSAAAGEDFFSIGSTVLSEHVDVAFTLMSDVLLHATFPVPELDLARKRERSALALRRSEPTSIAGRFFAHALYGHHPYGREETAASLDAITRDDVVGWARTQLAPAGAVLVIAGDVTLDRARALAQRFLGDWQGVAPVRHYGDPPAERATHILLVDRAGSPESTILLGNLALRPTDPAYDAAVVANDILGGGAGSRLFTDLREQHGWTYDVATRLTRRFDVGEFAVRTTVPNAVTDSVVREILRQMDELREHAPSDNELAAAEGYLTGSFPLTVETPQQIAAQLSMVKRLGLGDGYLAHYRQRIGAVTADDVRRAARRILRPDSAVIVVVGDGRDLYPGLRAIAPVEIVDQEGHALTPEALAPPAVLPFDTAALVAHRDSFHITAPGHGVVGWSVTALTRSDTGVTVTERSVIPASGLTQVTEGHLTPALELKHVTQTTDFPGGIARVDLTASRGAIRGTAIRPTRSGADTVAVDTAFAPGTLSIDMLQALVPALPLTVGRRFTLRSIDLGSFGASTLSVAVADTETVHVPAGSFRTFRISVTGTAGGVTYFVTTDRPHRVVKVEPSGQPLTFELVK